MATERGRQPQSETSPLLRPCRRTATPVSHPNIVSGSVAILRFVHKLAEKDEFIACEPNISTGFDRIAGRNLRNFARHTDRWWREHGLPGTVRRDGHQQHARWDCHLGCDSWLETGCTKISTNECGRGEKTDFRVPAAASRTILARKATHAVVERPRDHFVTRLLFAGYRLRQSCQNCLTILLICRLASSGSVPRRAVPRRQF